MRFERSRMLVVEKTESTNILASSMPPGSSVIAHEQTSGRGRLDHEWESPKGGLYLSAVFPDLDEPTLYVFWAGAAVGEALRNLGVSASVRWPNDIIVGRRKIAGILSEHKGDRVVVGIGINVNNAMRGKGLQATSVVELTGYENDVVKMSIRVLDSLSNMPGKQEIMARWRALDSTSGKQVTVTALSRTITGTAIGVSADGALMVETPDGVETIIEGTCNYAD